MNVENALNNYKEANSGNAIGASAYIVNVDNPTSKPIEQFALLLDWDDVRVGLVNKNKTLHNIYRWHVS